jgi:hypothetical protein
VKSLGFRHPHLSEGNRAGYMRPVQNTRPQIYLRWLDIWFAGGTRSPKNCNLKTAI